MPFFEFICRRCCAEFELLLTIKNREGRGETCPICGSTDFTRKISAPQIGASSKVGASPTSAGACGGSGGKFS